MKKSVVFLLVLCLIVSLAACGTNAGGLPAETPSEGTNTLSASSPPQSGPFADVPADADYADAVAWCRENKIMSGTSDATFSPEGTLTRSMLATVLYRAEGEPAVSVEPSFRDAQAGMWYSNAVVWADAQAIMRGYGNGLFGTDDPVTREQLATILWRYDGEKAAETISFPDADSISSYARTAVDWAVDNSVLTVREDGSVSPREAAIRAEVAAALYAYFPTKTDASEEDISMVKKVNVTFNGHTYTATLAENPTAQAFVQLIQERGGSLTLSASDYAGFEKVAPLGTSLPANNQQTTTSAGDFVLYSGNQIVLFYGSNSWSYTRLGKLDGDLSSLRADLGSGDVEITYSLVK